MQVAYGTDKGRVRDNNEDALVADPERGIFILADGLGGHRAGEVASDLAVREAHDHLKERIGAADYETVTRLLIDAAMRADHAIKEKAQTSYMLRGMGTTLVIVVVKNDGAFICHVGDSRAYLIREEDIEQLTRDHVADYHSEYGLPASSLRRSHILKRAVGTSGSTRPDTSYLSLEPDDIILICSDGLTDMLSDEEILDIVVENGMNMGVCADLLVQEANNKGGSDNISLILVLNSTDKNQFL